MRRRAFTLLEVILAIALVSMLSTAVLGFVWNLLDRRDALLNATRDMHAADALFERIESDMVGAIVAGGGGEGEAKAGIQGTATSLRILSRGVLVPGGPSTAGKTDNGVGNDLQVTDYQFDEATGSLRIARGVGEAEITAGVDDALTDRIARFRFRYFDGREWKSSFDSLKGVAGEGAGGSGQQAGLLTALEVSIWFKGLVPRPDAAAMKPRADDARESDSPLTPTSTDDLAATELAEPRRWGEPDRLRVIVVPDGPEAGWARRGASAESPGSGAASGGSSAGDQPSGSPRP